jgi:hypothetical protein
VAYGLMRPFQLHSDFRLDFIQRTRGVNSMAMFIHPKSGRQPMLLWAERVAVQPNTRYSFECYCADLSENSPTSFAAITLQVDKVDNRPTVFDTVDEWSRVHVTFTTGSQTLRDPTNLKRRATGVCRLGQPHRDRRYLPYPLHPGLPMIKCAVSNVALLSPCSNA